MLSQKKHVSIDSRNHVDGILARCLRLLHGQQNRPVRQSCISPTRALELFHAVQVTRASNGVDFLLRRVVNRFRRTTAAEFL